MQPFSNLRVLDLTHVLAGPFATYQLAVLGADVIKIEPPDEPDMVRSEGGDAEDNAKGLGTMFTSQAANKRALTLDLKSEQGREVFKRLVETADVLVENYRAGAMPALGLGYEQMSRVNPRLVYCSVSGFGQHGPKREHTAYDNVIQAFSGMMYTIGTEQTAPMRNGSPVLDYATGALTALAIAAALFKRATTGQGEYIDISMLDSAILMMGMHVTHQIVAGEPIRLNGNDSPVFPGYACFETANGELMVGAFTGKQHADLWRALGDTDRAEQVRTLTGADFTKRYAEDHGELQKIFLTRAADEWEQMLNAHKVPAARVRKLEEALSDDQLKTRAVLQTIGSPHQNGTVTLPVSAFTYQSDSPCLRSPPPMLGEHTDAILAELGYTEANIAELRARRVI